MTFEVLRFHSSDQLHWFISSTKSSESFLRKNCEFKIRIREMSSVLNGSSKFEFLKHANQKLFEYFSKFSSSTSLPATCPVCHSWLNKLDVSKRKNSASLSIRIQHFQAQKLYFYNKKSFPETSSSPYNLQCAAISTKQDFWSGCWYLRVSLLILLIRTVTNHS